MSIRKKWENLLRIRRGIALFIIGIFFFTLQVARADEPPDRFAKDDIAVRTAFPDVVQDVPTPAAADYLPSPSQSNPIYARVFSWAIIAAGLGGAVFLIWRNHQKDKNERRWKKRQAKWRLF